MRLSDKIVKLRKTNECLFDDEAICFYKPFPLQKLTVSTLIRYIAECLDKADIALVVLSAFLVSLVGLLLPRLNSLLFVRVIASGSIRVLLAISMFMISVSVSRLLIGAINAMLSGRMSAKVNLSVQASTMMRILSLPADFFKQWSSGELASRSQQTLINGIQKIKLSGAEKRAYTRWSDLYAKLVAITYHPPLFLRLNTVISTAISLFGTLMMYSMALQSGVSVSDYYAFNAAYGMVSGAFMSLAGSASA